MTALALLIFLLIATATLAAWLADRKGRPFWVVFAFAFFTATGLLLAVAFLFVRPFGLGRPSDTFTSTAVRTD